MVTRVELAETGLVVHWRRSSRSVPYATIEGISGSARGRPDTFVVVVTHGKKTTTIDRPLVHGERFLTELRKKTFAATGRYVGDYQRDIKDHNWLEMQKADIAPINAPRVFMAMLLVSVFLAAMLNDAGAELDYEKRLLRDGAHADGIIIEHRHEVGSRPRMAYRFTADDGETYERVMESSPEDWQHYEQGAVVAVRYFRETPNDSRLAEENPESAMIKFYLPAVMIFVIVVLLPLFFFAAHLVDRRNARRALRQPDPVEAAADRTAIYGHAGPIPDEKAPEPDSATLAKTAARENRHALYGAAVFFAVAAALTVLCVRGWLAREEMERLGIDAVGMLEAKYETSSASKIGMKIIYPVGQGRTAERTDIFPYWVAKRYRIGHPVSVRYLPDKPGQSLIRDELDTDKVIVRTAVAIFLSASILYLLVSVWRVLRTGVPIKRHRSRDEEATEG
jgi:hypothetical protein